MNPKISVLMPVYNGASYLREAIDSILNQTFTDFEFLIINDGSSDESKNIVLSYPDKRIRFLQNDQNMGIVHTLNWGLREAVGEYIARMDADDVSLPTRLEKQMLVFRNPRIGVCGAWIKTFGGDNKTIEFPPNYKEIKATMLFENPVAHPSVMVRKSSLNSEYNIEDLHAEDYGLWAGLIDSTEFYNIPEVLLHYRIHSTNITTTKEDIAAISIQNIHKRILKKLDIFPSMREMAIHESISKQCVDILPSGWSCTEVNDWKSKILKRNSITRYFSEDQLNTVLNQRLYLFLNQLIIDGLGMYLRVIRSKLYSETKLTWQQKLHLALKSVVRTITR